MWPRPTDRTKIAWGEVGNWPRRQAAWGDFDLEGVHVEDALFTVMHPNFRPFQVSFYNFEADRLREVCEGGCHWVTGRLLFWVVWADSNG